MSVRGGVLSPISSDLGRVDAIELTRIWLDGRRKFQARRIEGTKVKDLIKLMRSAKRVRNYASGPSTPKYLMSLYEKGSGNLLGEVSARGNLVQVGSNVGFIPSRSFLEILDEILVGVEEKEIDSSKLAEYMKREE